MAKGLAKNYTFSVASKTITLSGITTVRLDKLALITNTTTNKILYNFADSTVSTATVAGSVITLSVLQGGESDSDKLRIDYDIESSDTAAFSDTTQPVSAAALPLPTGAATEAKQLADGHNVVVTSAPTTAVTGTFFQGTQPVSAAALPLPTGAATEAKQDTGNTSVGSIDTKTPGLGQALAAASTPVVLTASQVTTLTPPAAISGFATETTLAAIKDSAGIKKITDALPAGANTIGALTANQSVNLSQLAGNTISSGVGATGTGTIRVVQANDAGKTILSKGGSAAVSGNNTIIAAGTNKLKIKAFSLTTTSTTSVTCIFQSGAGGTELWRVVLQAPTGVSVGANLVVPAPDYIFSTASATLLNLNLSSAQTIHYSVSYIDEA